MEIKIKDTYIPRLTYPIQNAYQIPEKHSKI